MASFIHRICWSPTVKGDFDVSGKTNAAMTSMETGGNVVSEIVDMLNSMAKGHLLVF